MPIKTFRGLIADEVQDTIVLHTNDGSTGYRVVKFQIINNTPGAAAVKGVVKIYKVSQTTPDAVIDFSDNTLLGAAFYEDNDSVTYVHGKTIIFDNEIFNQDIYVTYSDLQGSQPMNYYIELEQVKLDLNQNTVATLKDIRNLS
tara:strand:- start:288 stop:719 length:432 start_codon:yes stop_codon:yes gene_type:complete